MRIAKPVPGYQCILDMLVEAVILQVCHTRYAALRVFGIGLIRPRLCNDKDALIGMTLSYF